MRGCSEEAAAAADERAARCLGLRVCVCVCVRRGGMLQGTEGKFSPPSKAADKWQGRCAKERGEEGSRRMRKEGRGRRGRRGSGTAPAVGAASPGGMERLSPPNPG